MVKKTKEWKSMFSGAQYTKREPVPKQRAWRATVEDERLVQELKAKLGIKNDSDLVRMGLRALAAKEGLAA